MTAAGKKLLAGAASGCWLIGSLLAVDCFLFRRDVARLEANRKPIHGFDWVARRAGIRPELLQSVGSAAAPRKGRFQEYPLVKESGAIRIGAFGDSFTYGEEVGPGLDYPSLLGALFRTSGFRNVEVINFGNPWHGFHQSVRFWEQLGRRYGLDIVLLGPQTFYPERDVSFNHGQPDEPYYMHGRYVLRDARPVFEDVIGGPDFGDRFINYFRFFPHWRYLRYDAAAPMFLRSLLPWGRTIANPFYYGSARSFARELSEIDRALLRRVAQEEKQVVLLDADASAVETGSGAAPNLYAEHYDPPTGFPYERALHFSAAGNERVARSFFDILTGKGATELPSLAFRARPNGGRGFRGDAACFSDFDRVSWSAGGAPLAEFEYALPYGDGGASVEFRRDGVKSLFAFRSSETDLFDLLFLPLDFRLASGMRATLRIDAGGEKRVVDLGEAAPYDGGLSMGSASFDGFDVVRSADFSFGLEANPARFLKAGIDAGKIRSGSVLLGDREIAILARTAKGELLLEPKAGALVWIKPGYAAALDVDRLRPAGTASLDLRGPRERRFPIAAWVKTRSRRASTHGAAGLAYAIVRSTEDAGLAVLQARRVSGSGGPPTRSR